MQFVPVLERCLMTSIYLGLRPNFPAPPFQGFLQSGPWTQGLRPGLSCWTPLGSLVSRQKLASHVSGSDRSVPTDLVGRLGYRVGFREGAQPVNASQSYKGKDASTCRSNLGEARSKQIPIRLNRCNG